MTGRLIAFLIIIAGVAVLVFTNGHWWGRRSRRHDHRDGYLEGVKAEAARWKAVTGTEFGRLQAWRTGRGPDPFANLAAATEVLPSAEVLLAEADAVLGKPPSVAEVDEMTAQYQAAQPRPSMRSLGPPFRNWNASEPGPPVVADITSAARWRPPGIGEVPVVTGRVVTPGPGPGNGWDRAAGLPDYAAAALGGHRTVDECVDSIVMRAVGR